ncbi:MAG: DUF3108 domain-containing protein [Bacteroidia bacterium]|nr:DUF3108 domain-containing protein [Bacteroidia bacterium]
MIRILFTYLTILILGSGFKTDYGIEEKLRNHPNQAFTFGEQLKYRVHYGWINAASIDIKVGSKAKKVNGRSTYNIKAVGKTYRSFDWAYKVRDHFETYIDSVSLAPLKYYKNVREDNYRDEDLVYYNHSKQRLTGKKKNMDMPAYLQDIISGVFYARTIDFAHSKPGATFPISIYLDQEIYNLKFRYLGTETIKTDLGKIKCFKLRPQLVVDRVFKDEDDMTIWVSADKNKIPVRVKADIYIGSVKVDITDVSGLRNPFTSKL